MTHRHFLRDAEDVMSILRDGDATITRQRRALESFAEAVDGTAPVVGAGEQDAAAVACYVALFESVRAVLDCDSLIRHEKRAAAASIIANVDAHLDHLLKGDPKNAINHDADDDDDDLGVSPSDYATDADEDEDFDIYGDQGAASHASLLTDADDDPL